MKNINKKSKSNKKTIVLNIILFIIIIVMGLVFYAAYYKGYIIIKNNNDKNIIEKDKVVEEQLEKEEIITDSNLIIDLKSKVDYLTLYKSHMSHMISNLYKEENITYIPYTDKLNIVLESLVDEFSIITIPKTSIEKSIGIYYTNIVLVENKQIPIIKVKERYQKLFGEEINDFVHIEGCPSYLYDNVNQVYYLTTSCSKGTGVAKEYSYDIKYTMDSNYAYVYKSVGYSDLSKDSTDKNIKINLYSSYSNEVYKENIDSIQLSNFKIDETNYNEFSQYKYKFKKGNNNYYFVSVERIK